MRESLFEKLKNKSNPYIEDLSIMYNLIFENYVGADNYLVEAFDDSPFVIYYENFVTALNNMIECKANKYLHGNLDDKIRIIKNDNFDITLDCFLNYLEFLKTLLKNKNNSFNHKCKQLEMIIDDRCNKLGYEFRFDEKNKYYRVSLRNTLVESIALNLKKSTQDKIYAYLMIRKGNVVSKRETLKSLADDIEEICKQYNNIPEYSKLRQFIQCTRHTKDSPNRIFPFYYEKEEEWLDKTFEMIVGILGFTRTKEIVSEIKELEHQNNSNTTEEKK